MSTPLNVFFQNVDLVQGHENLGMEGISLEPTGRSMPPNRAFWCFSKVTIFASRILYISISFATYAVNSV